MVIGLMFLVSVVAVMAGPIHAAGLAKGFGIQAQLPWWAYTGIPIGMIFGAIAVVLPMRAGAKALRETEF